MFTVNSKKIASHGWHAECVAFGTWLAHPLTSYSISFEPVPSDYTMLKINTLPEVGSGGDTLWASGYEAYDRLFPAWQKFAETLTATHAQVCSYPSLAPHLSANVYLFSPTLESLLRSMVWSSLRRIEEPQRTLAQTSGRPSRFSPLPTFRRIQRLNNEQ